MSRGPTTVALGPGAEFDRIRRIAERLGRRAAGLGDDCAVVPAAAGELVASTDTSVEGVHFRRDWITPAEIGWRAAAGALSDLAAAAARPVGLLAALTVPAGATEDLEPVMDGVARAADSVGAVVLGGDLTAGPALVIGVTVFGRAERPMSRRGGRPGDGLWVTGSLGGARAALTMWRAGQAPGEASRAAFAHPEPRVRVARWLAEHGARALIDLSDGLAGDVRHLAAAGGTGAEVDLGALPLHVGVGPAAALAGEPAEVFAARGGEDYELLAAMPPEFDAAAAALAQEQGGIPLTRVGRLTVGHEVRLLLGGAATELAGFDHFG